MKTIKVKIEVIVKVPQDTDTDDLIVDCSTSAPKIIVFTNGGLRKVRHKVVDYDVSHECC